MARKLSRRGLIAAAAKASPLLLAPVTSFARRPGARALSFYHTHTGETLNVAYWENGEYLADAMTEINHLLRDFRTGDVHPIDRGVLDILHATRTMLGTNERFEIISGYRSPATNSMLANNGAGVAKKSFHMQGRALDIRIPGVATENLRDSAISLRAGGVGYYRKSNFIHVDTGHVRTW